MKRPVYVVNVQSLACFSKKPFRHLNKAVFGRNYVHETTTVTIN